MTYDCEQADRLIDDRWGVCGRDIAWAVWVLWLLSGCAALQVPNRPADEARAISAFLAGWQAAGLPSLAGCDIENARIIHADPATFQARCQVPTTAAASCLSGDTVQRGLYTHAVPVVVIRPGQAPIDSTGGPIVHELAHAAISCTHLGTGLDPYDSSHRNPRIWSAAGGPLSAQGRAAAMLR